MSFIEGSRLSDETPAIPTHGTNTQANATYHMRAAALVGVEGAIQDVTIKPAIKTFLETCDTNPRIVVWNYYSRSCVVTD